MSDRVDRSWWKAAQGEVGAELGVAAALSSAVDKRSAEARGRLAREKKRRAEPKTVRIEKMYPVAKVSDLLEFEPDTIRDWCKAGVIEAHYVRGQWRIPESALKKLIADEDKKRA